MTKRSLLFTAFATTTLLFTAFFFVQAKAQDSRQTTGITEPTGLSKVNQSASRLAPASHATNLQQANGFGMPANAVIQKQGSRFSQAPQSFSSPSNLGHQTSPKPRPQAEYEKYEWICQTSDKKVVFGNIADHHEIEIQTKYALVKIPMTDVIAFKTVSSPALTSKPIPSDSVAAKDEDQSPTNANEAVDDSAPRSLPANSKSVVVAVKDGSIFSGVCKMKDLQLTTDWGQISVKATSVQMLSSTRRGSLTIGQLNDGMHGWALAPAGLVLDRLRVVSRKTNVNVSTGAGLYAQEQSIADDPTNLRSTQDMLDKVLGH